MKKNHILRLSDANREPEFKGFEMLITNSTFSLLPNIDMSEKKFASLIYAISSQNENPERLTSCYIAI